MADIGAPHWTDQYATRRIGENLSDQDVANKVRMLMRDDLDHEMVCVVARDRIAKLARRVRDLEQVSVDLAHPVDATRGASPIVLYFATDADRDEFVAAVTAAKPSMRAVKL